MWVSAAVYGCVRVCVCVGGWVWAGGCANVDYDLLTCLWFYDHISTNRLWPSGLCAHACLGVCGFFGYMFDKFGLLVSGYIWGDILFKLHLKFFSNCNNITYVRYLQLVLVRTIFKGSNTICYISNWHINQAERKIILLSYKIWLFIKLN